MVYDSYKYQALRERLAISLSEKGIKDSNVLKAIAVVKRHLFVESALRDQAYNDIALPLSNDQTISQPYTVAFMTELLNLKKGDKVLEIGTGSGYQAAILAQMGTKVYSIERHRDLYNKAQNLLESMNYTITLRCADGSLGWRANTPYNAIIVTAGAPKIPEPLKQQLAIGGRLVIPVGNRDSQRMTLITKKSENEYQIVDRYDFKFVPLLGKEGWNENGT